MVLLAGVSHNSELVLPLGGGIFLLAGLVMLAISAVWRKRQQAFLQRGLLTTGVVVGRKQQISATSDDSGYSVSTHYHPVVEFTTADGQQITYTDDTGSNPPKYGRGQPVPVRYDPQNPPKAQIDSFFSNWGGLLVLTGMGALFAAVGGIMLIAGTFSRRSAGLSDAPPPSPGMTTETDPGVALLFVGGGFFLVGLFLLSISVFLGKPQWAFLQRSLPATGVVVGVEQETASSVGVSVSSVMATYYHPVVEFTTSSGQQITYTDGDCSTSPRQGRQVRVRYDPQYPQEAQISSFFPIGWMVLAVGAAGVFATVLGGGLVIASLSSG